MLAALRAQRRDPVAPHVERRDRALHDPHALPLQPLPLLGPEVVHRAAQGEQRNVVRVGARDEARLAGEELHEVVFEGDEEARGALVAALGQHVEAGQAEGAAGGEGEGEEEPDEAHGRERPLVDEQPGRRPEGDDVGQAVELDPEVALGLGHPRHPPVEGVDHAGQSERGLTTTVSDIEHIESRSLAGITVIKVFFQPGTNADSAVTQISNLAMAQSLRSTSDSYKLMARIAESTMPKVRNAIEMVQYAIFPVFLLFVVLSGHQATGVIKSYASSLFWIQLWAPLYAVMNFIITMYSRSEYTNGSAGSGLSIEHMSFLNTAIVSDQAIAGMLVISIPAIAAAIVKGGEVGLQSVAGLVGPPRDPEKIASGLAM